jgi:predicted dehydrogenase
LPKPNFSNLSPVQQNLPFLVTFTYTAFSAPRRIRQLVADGAIGSVRLITAEYPQGWLATRAELSGNRQAEWRCDPSRLGPVGTADDIGVHVFSLVRSLTGLEVESLVAQLNAVVSGREIDDMVSVLVKFVGDVPGVYFCSQALFGFEND